MINNDEKLPNDLVGLMDSDIIMQAVTISQYSKFEEVLLIKLDNCIELDDQQKTIQLKKILEAQSSQAQEAATTSGNQEEQEQIFI